MQINDRDIGREHEPYVIAEIGVNHDGEVERALTLTDAAADAGADAVKLQYFETDRLMSKAAKLAAYQRSAGETDPIEMLRRLELSLDEMSRVVDRAHERGLHAIVTVFSVELVESAETLAWDAYKTASPDIIHKPLLDRLAATGKPMIVSTGASDHDEVARAREWLDIAEDRVAFMQCVSCYPTAPEDASVRICTGLDTHLAPCPVGYSDHTRTINAGRNARKCGACLFEKHLTDDVTRTGPDHAMSLTPNEFRAYVEMTRLSDEELEQEEHQHVIDRTLWTGFIKEVLECELDVREVARQSIVATRDIEAGATIEQADLTCKRPGTGVPPFYMHLVVGGRATRAILADTPLSEEDVE